MFAPPLDTNANPLSPIDTLRSVNRTFDHLLNRLSAIGRRNVSGMFLQIFICNTDAIQEKTNYTEAALLLEMAQTKLLGLPVQFLQDKSDEVHALWRRIQTVPYLRIFNQLRHRYGAQTIHPKITRVQKDLCDLIQLLE